MRARDRGAAVEDEERDARDPRLLRLAILGPDLGAQSIRREQRLCRIAREAGFVSDGGELARIAQQAAFDEIRTEQVFDERFGVTRLLRPCDQAMGIAFGCRAMRWKSNAMPTLCPTACTRA